MRESFIRKEDIRLPGKGNPKFHGARPVYSNHLDDKWIRTSRLAIKNSLSLLGRYGRKDDDLLSEAGNADDQFDQILINLTRFWPIWDLANAAREFDQYGTRRDHGDLTNVAFGQVRPRRCKASVGRGQLIRSPRPSQNPSHLPFSKARILRCSEALGQLGQDEPASGMALEPLDGLCPISGSVAIALHHRNSDSCLAVVVSRGGSGQRRHLLLLASLHPCKKHLQDF